MENKVANLINPYLYRDILSITQGGIDFSRFENKTVLITGAGELVGYYIACALLIYNDLYNSHIKVIAVGKEQNLMKKYAELTSREDIDFIISEVYNNFGSYKADYIIHNDFSDNMENEAITNLLKYIKANNVISTVINSSLLVYGTVYNGKSEILEDDLGYVDLASPKSSIVQSLRMAECAAINFAKAEDMNIMITRSAIDYGVPFEKEHPLCKLFAEDCHNTVAVFIGANISSKINSYCYVTDFARALLTVLFKGTGGEVYNIASDNSVASNNELQNIISKTTNNEAVVKLDNDIVSSMDATQYILNTDKLKALGFKSSVDLENGYKRIGAIIRNSN